MCVLVSLNPSRRRFQLPVVFQRVSAHARQLPLVQSVAEKAKADVEESYRASAAAVKSLTSQQILLRQQVCVVVTCVRCLRCGGDVEPFRCQ